MSMEIAENYKSNFPILKNPEKGFLNKLKGKELMEKFHRGFKNKYHKKNLIQSLMDEVERAYAEKETTDLWITQLKRKAGFFDKKNNIFSRGE